MNKSKTVPESMARKYTHYCPGCTHGIVHKLIAEAIDELSIEGVSIGVASVGCSVMAYDYFNCDMVQAAHGRAPAVATGIKRVHPDRIVFTYQGDGDLAAIGLSEAIHAANRGENITIFFINNGIYGMTGGQMAPTTLNGHITQTTPAPHGRDTQNTGYPLKICEIFETILGAVLVERVALDGVNGVKESKRAILRAFTAQIEGLGFSIIEFLSTCPTNWKLDPYESLMRVKGEMREAFPVKRFK